MHLAKFLHQSIAVWHPSEALLLDLHKVLKKWEIRTGSKRQRPIPCDPALLQNIPGWHHSLELHHLYWYQGRYLLLGQEDHTQGQVSRPDTHSSVCCMSGIPLTSCTEHHAQAATWTQWKVLCKSCTPYQNLLLSATKKTKQGFHNTT